MAFGVLVFLVAIFAILTVIAYRKSVAIGSALLVLSLVLAFASGVANEKEKDSNEKATLHSPR